MKHYKNIAAGIGPELQSLTTFGRENTSDSSADNGSAGGARALSDVTPTIPPGAGIKTRKLCENIMKRRVVNQQQLDTYRAEGADLGMRVTYGDIRGLTPFQCAAVAGNGMAVAAIVASEQEVLVNAADGNGLTPLALICRAKDFDDKTYPRVDSASDEHDARLTGLEALLGANANQHRMDSAGLKPIHYAAGSNFPGLIRRLVEQDQPTGIDSAARTISIIDSPDQHGNTPLHAAAKHNALESTKTLIDLGAQTTVINRQEQTPLHLLCMDRSNNNIRGGELACLLLSDKSDVEDGRVDKKLRMTWSDYAAKNGMGILLEYVTDHSRSALNSRERRIKAAHTARDNVATGRKSKISPEAASKVFNLLKSLPEDHPHNLQGLCLVVIREALLKKLKQDQQSAGQGACGATRSLDDALADLHMYFRDKEKLLDDQAFFN